MIKHRVAILQKTEIRRLYSQICLHNKMQMAFVDILLLQNFLMLELENCNC